MLPPPPPPMPPLQSTDEPAPATTAAPAAESLRRYVADEPGQLTLGWTTVFWMGWLLVGASFGAVWYSSYLTGFATWWLGPESEPRYAFMLLPFLIPLALCIMALRGVRRLPWFGVGGSLLLAGIAAGDLGATTSYSLVEFAIAAGALLVSLASSAGMLRTPTAD